MPNDTTVSAASGNKKWAHMAMNDKIVFVVKICIMVCTGGFVFANVLADDVDPTDSAK